VARILSVLPHAGGNVAPTVEILRALTGRGHDAVVLGHNQLASAADAAGLAFRPLEHARPWSPTVQNPTMMSLLAYLPMASDRGVGRDVALAAADAPPDIVLVDCMLPGALRAARATGAPVALVMHAPLGYWNGQWAPTAPMGIWLRARGALPTHRDSLPDVGILTTMPEIDPVPPDSRFPRERIVQTGPAIGRASETTAGPDAPILISLSTISYPGQQQVLQRLVDAVGRLGIPAIVTTGPSLDPADIVASANVDVRRFVPHEQLLPTVRLVVGHGGHGTTMRALAHGVPVLVVPMSSVADHAMVADAVVAAGAGGRVSKRASADELARAIAQILDDDGVRENAARLGATLRGRDAAAAAADLIEATIRGDRAPVS
jgi:UDP:flavonoid glycosyltransferase YjiC (YdhE family)